MHGVRARGGEPEREARVRPGSEDLRLLLARLPSVAAMQRDARVKALRDRYEDRRIDAAIREVLRDARERIRFRPRDVEGDGLGPEGFAVRVGARLEREARAADGDPINGSGILFHPAARGGFAGTAAGRASRLALAHAAFEEDGDGRVSGLLRKLTGAEDGLVCRSVAAALLLAVRSLAEGAEVVFGRNQLGLIDAPYDERPVDPVALCGLAGARLVETGATNKTRLSDYRRVLGARTALIVTARPSTCATQGFTEETAPEEIVRAGAESGAAVLHMAGDTTLRPVSSAPSPAARSVAEALRYGTPLIIAAGGGLIGGPPCGLLIGERGAIARMRGHGTWAAAQASRHVKAGLEARLAELAGVECDLARHPAGHMLAPSREEVGDRARRLLERLSEDGRFRAECTVVEARAYLSAYRLPAEGLPSYAVSIRAPGVRSDDLADRWFRGTPPLLVHCGRDRVRIDMRGVEKNRIPDVARIVRTGL